jgi:hypothetical protein
MNLKPFFNIKSKENPKTLIQPKPKPNNLRLKIENVL